jgi:hypothetical protein
LENRFIIQLNILKPAVKYIDIKGLTIPGRNPAKVIRWTSRSKCNKEVIPAPTSQTIILDLQVDDTKVVAVAGEGGNSISAHYLVTQFIT